MHAHGPDGGAERGGKLGPVRGEFSGVRRGGGGGAGN